MSPRLDNGIKLCHSLSCVARPRSLGFSPFPRIGDLEYVREQVLQAKVMAVLNHRDSPCRVWRNNVGMLKDARGIPVRYGLGVGSPDLVGLVLGSAQFLAVEIKTPTGRLSAEQDAWLSTIRRMGGIGLVMRSVEDAEKLVATLRASMQEAA